MGTKVGGGPRYLVVGIGQSNPMFYPNSSPLQTAATVVSVRVQPSQNGVSAIPAGGS